jgi:hypothetical protein
MKASVLAGASYTSFLSPLDGPWGETNDLRQLTALGLGRKQVTDEGLKGLKNLKQLTSLDLAGKEVAAFEEWLTGLPASASD